MSAFFRLFFCGGSGEGQASRHCGKGGRIQISSRNGFGCRHSQAYGAASSNAAHISSLPFLIVHTPQIPNTKTSGACYFARVDCKRMAEPQIDWHAADCRAGGRVAQMNFSQAVHCSQY
jgi:hypothetical protein